MFSWMGALNVKTPLVVAAGLSGILALVKLGAFFWTGSLTVLGSFLDSCGDTATSLLNHRLSGLAREEADREHPFGHGGFEVVASLFQGLLIGAFGVGLLYGSFRRLVEWKEFERVEVGEVPFAIAAMTLSAIAGYLIQRYLGHHEAKMKERRERSLSLVSDRAHYAADFWQNIAGALGLLCVWYFEVFWLDSILGAFAGVLLLRAGFPVLKNALKDVVSAEVDRSMQQQVVDLVFGLDEKIVGLHRLRMRQHGPNLFIDFHMKLPAAMSLQEAHDIGEVVAERLRAEYANADVLIHLDPDTEPDDEQWEPSYKL